MAAQVSAPNDLFDESFQALQVDVPSGASLFTLLREGSLDKPPLILLHGCPQCHTAWYDVARRLPKDLTLVIPDLPGYVGSTICYDGTLISLDPQLRAVGQKAL